MFLQISAFCGVFSHAFCMLFWPHLCNTIMYGYGKFVAHTVLFPPEIQIVRLCISDQEDPEASYVVKVVFVLLLIMEWLACLPLGILQPTLRNSPAYSQGFSSPSWGFSSLTLGIHQPPWGFTSTSWRFASASWEFSSLLSGILQHTLGIYQCTLWIPQLVFEITQPKSEILQPTMGIPLLMLKILHPTLGILQVQVPWTSVHLCHIWVHMLWRKCLFNSYLGPFVLEKVFI